MIILDAKIGVKSFLRKNYISRMYRLRHTTSHGNISYKQKTSNAKQNI